jgi:predicted transcriptional regulator
MNIEIRDAHLLARIQKQVETTGSGSVEELLHHLLETQEEQDRWLSENREAIRQKIAKGLEQSERGETLNEEELAAYFSQRKACSK